MQTTAHSLKSNVRKMAYTEIREQICDAIQSGSAGAYKRLDEYSMIETVIAIGSIQLTPYGTPSTNEVPEAIAPYLTEHNVLLLQNHGARTVSPKLFRSRRIL